MSKIDIVALLAGLGSKQAAPDHFKMARGLIMEAQKMLLEIGVPSSDVVAASCACLTDLMAATVRPEGVDAAIDGMAEIMKRQVRSRHELLAGLGFPTKAKAEPAKAGPAEVKPAASDWIEWKGGECPVAPSAKVQAYLRNGERQISAACIFRWDHIGVGGDIIAYRVL